MPRNSPLPHNATLTCIVSASSSPYFHGFHLFLPPLLLFLSTARLSSLDAGHAQTSMPSYPRPFSKVHVAHVA